METFYYITGYVLTLFFLGWYIKYTGERNAKECKYEFMYRNLQTMLYDPLRPINRTSWKELNACFNELCELPYKNVEKTEILLDEFLKLYEPVIEEIDQEFKEMNSEEEYDPGQIFSEFNHT